MKQSRWAGWRCVAGGCVMVLFCILAAAQDQNQPRSGTTNIPFDFYVAGNKMPAGPYILDMVAPTYVTLRSKDGKLQQDLYFFQAASPGNKPQSKIIFALRDGKYYFSQVWSWFGKAQLTSFTPKATDQSKDVPLVPAEKVVAKPAGSL